MVEHRKRARDRDHARRQHKTDQLVAVGGITEKARALLVFTDCDEHGAGGRSVEAPKQVTSRRRDCGDGPVVGGIGFEIEPQHVRAGDATQSAFAAGELGPAIADGEEERGQSERE